MIIKGISNTKKITKKQQKISKIKLKKNKKKEGRKGKKKQGKKVSLYIFTRKTLRIFYTRRESEESQASNLRQSLESLSCLIIIHKWCGFFFPVFSLDLSFSYLFFLVKAEYLLVLRVSIVVL